MCKGAAAGFRVLYEHFVSKCLGSSPNAQTNGPYTYYTNERYPTTQREKRKIEEEKFQPWKEKWVRKPQGFPFVIHRSDDSDPFWGRKLLWCSYLQTSPTSIITTHSDALVMNFELGARQKTLPLFSQNVRLRTSADHVAEARN